ncbi:histidine kinase [Sphingosinithalassobacter portus]|uniref:HAMP domain-containing sensor histidine kinase n=1 Tax=Stakelama portus TaxID=2676234 RepID=UPI000D6DD8F5|nr:histidine kinase [Sphingosinithalassobacter portus]
MDSDAAPLAPAESMALDRIFLWDPHAIGFLAQLILGTLFAAYVGYRLFREYRLRKATPAMILLLATMLAQGPSLVFSFLKAVLVGEYQIYFLPWISPFQSLAAFTFIQFAYRFPTELGSRTERRLAGAVTAAIAVYETGFAVSRWLSSLNEEIVYRPAQLDLLLLGSLLWLCALFWRQMRAARGTRHAPAARGFVVVGAIVLIQVITLTFRAYGFFDVAFSDSLTELVNCWLFMAQVAATALVYFGYMPERSSFLAKLSGMTITLLMVVIVGISWLLLPVFEQTYREPNMVTTGQTYRFDPTSDGGYAMRQVAFRPERDVGTPIHYESDSEWLPFQFPFFGKRYDRAFVHFNGMLSFDSLATWRDVRHRPDNQPIIYALSIFMGDSSPQQFAPGAAILIKRHANRTVVTWNRMNGGTNIEGRFTVQAVLHRNGAIEISYVELPKNFIRTEYGIDAPWMIGIAPGNDAGGVARIAIGELPLAVPRGVGIIDDFQRRFLTAEDRLFGPLAVALILSILFILLALPLFLRVNMLAPLKDLLRGVERFREGQLETEVPVRFPDEIGSLSASFNAMARAQRNLVETLEQRVAERTEQAVQLAARNAQLEERDRLSRDLHDTVSQTLFSSALLADTLQQRSNEDPMPDRETLDQLGNLNRHALAEVRAMLNELRGSDSRDDQSFVPMLAELLARFADAHPELALVSELDGNAQLPTEVQMQFLRVAQEALNNIVRHAVATHVRIFAQAVEGHAFLEICDDGCGFDTMTRHKGFGLAIQRERAAAIGASIEIASARNSGTTVTMAWTAATHD